MGHTRIGELPRTRKWQEVIELIAIGASARQVATAVLDAAERGMHLGTEHKGLVEAVWLLSLLPEAAKSDDFASALRAIGVQVPDQPTLMDIVSGLGEAIDRRQPKNTERSDLGELAQAALCEVLVDVVTPRAQTLFGMPPSEVQRAIAQLHPESQFGELARSFFARLADKAIQYYVCRCTDKFIGPDQRFANLADKEGFDQAVTLHTNEMSYIVADFSGKWRSKALYEHGHISRNEAGAFAHVGLRKVVSEMKAGAC